jgi:hypothetical protein
VGKWISQPVGQWDEREKRKVLQDDWTTRLVENRRETERIVRPGADPVRHQRVPEDRSPNRAVLKSHSGL